MRSVEVSASMLEQAYSRLKSARTALKDRNYAYAVRSSQECVELSLKAALRLVGVEYPKKHDVSRVLIMNKERFPEWFTVEKFAEISTALAEKREPAMYGDELRMMPASRLFDEGQAKEALRDAEQVYSASVKLLNEVKLKIEGESSPT
ncbi:MAG: HEPN domain-containing protein [Candidatus Bathyarchaeia archaeon]